MAQLAKKETEVIGRPLRVLVPLIEADLKRGRDAAEQAALPYYEAAGDKMLEAKPQLRHGEFQDWIKRNFKLSYRQAARYMDYANRTTKSAARVTFTSLRDFERSENENVGTGKTTWHEPVKAVIDRVDTETLNLKRAELMRDEERAAERKLALQLIDIGYKVLARELHPDKGGSRVAMARLNAVRARLKNCV